MTKLQIIEKLAKDKAIEILAKPFRCKSYYLKDLCQDLYLQLLNKEEKLIVSMYERGELKYYILKMLKNNINSKTSPFYKKYEKFRLLADEIQDEANSEQEDRHI